jgi:hypothetical protein
VYTHTRHFLCPDLSHQCTSTQGEKAIKKENINLQVNVVKSAILLTDV